MLTLIWNPRGGQGKTTLAYSLCLELDRYYITNDPVNSSVVLNSYDKVLDTITREDFLSKDIIYDGGGFFSDTLSPILKASEQIIMPIEAEIISMASFAQIAEKMVKFNDKLYLVINKVESDKEFEETKSFLIKKGVQEDHILRMSKSKLFKQVFKLDKPVSVLMKDKVIANWFKKSKIIDEYEELLEIVR